MGNGVIISNLIGQNFAQQAAEQQEENQDVLGQAALFDWAIHNPSVPLPLKATAHKGAMDLLEDYGGNDIQENLKPLFGKYLSGIAMTSAAKGAQARRLAAQAQQGLPPGMPARPAPTPMTSPLPEWMKQPVTDTETTAPSTTTTPAIPAPTGALADLLNQPTPTPAAPTAASPAPQIDQAGLAGYLPGASAGGYLPALAGVTSPTPTPPGDPNDRTALDQFMFRRMAGLPPPPTTTGVAAEPQQQPQLRVAAQPVAPQPAAVSPQQQLYTPPKLSRRERIADALIAMGGGLTGRYPSWYSEEMLQRQRIANLNRAYSQGQMPLDQYREGIREILTGIKPTATTKATLQEQMLEDALKAEEDRLGRKLTSAERYKVEREVGLGGAAHYRSLGLVAGTDTKLQALAEKLGDKTFDPAKSYRVIGDEQGNPVNYSAAGSTKTAAQSASERLQNALVASGEAKTPEEASRMAADLEVKRARRLATGQSGETIPEEDMRAIVKYDIINGTRSITGRAETPNMMLYTRLRGEELNKNIGLAIGAKADFKALSSALTATETRLAQLRGNEQQANYNLTQALELSRQVPRGQAQLWNDWKQTMQGKLIDYPELRVFHNYVETGMNEVAQLLSSASGGSVTTDSAKEHARQMLSSADPEATFESAVFGLMDEARGRIRAVSEAADNVRGRIIAIGTTGDPGALASGNANRDGLPLATGAQKGRLPPDAILMQYVHKYGDKAEDELRAAGYGDAKGK